MYKTVCYSSPDYKTGNRSLRQVISDGLVHIGESVKELEKIFQTWKQNLRRKKLLDKSS